MHTIIHGQTVMGKTTLAKILVRQAERQGMGAIVLDPLKSGWGKDTVYAKDSSELLALAKNCTGKLLLIDESSMALDKYDHDTEWLAKTARHLGHVSIFVCHRIKDIAPGIRSQCSQSFIFRCRRDDAEDVMREYDFPELRNATRLPKFHFFRVVLDTDTIQAGRIDPRKGTIYLKKLQKTLDRQISVDTLESV